MSKRTDQENKRRERVEGVLHRSLPASLTIREAIPGEADDGLMRLRLSVSSEEPYLRQSWWDEPWMETLGHKEGEVDLTRLNGGAAVLGNHNRWTSIGNTPLAGIGAVEKAWLSGKKLEADITISRREALSDLRQDILDGLVRNVSIGYTINERTLVKANGEGKPDDYRVTSWTPFEISLVDIPADATVGLGRSREDSPNQRYRVFDIAPQTGIAGNPSLEKTMDEENNVAPAAAQTRAATPTVKVEDVLAGERARIAEIGAIGKQHGLADDAARAIETGVSVDAFRKTVLEKINPGKSVEIAESRDIGMSQREIEQFSFRKALLVAQDPMNPEFRKAAGFELEVSEAARAKRMDLPKEREGGITIAPDVLRASITSSRGVAEALIARAMAGAAGSQAFRDLVVGTATAGGNLVATNLLASSFIDLLRARARVIEMGATVLSDLSGNIAIPRQTGGASTYWVSENGAVTESQPAFDQVTLSPKTVGTFTDFSRRLLLQSSMDVEAFVRAELALAIAMGIDAAALNGTGADSQPTGLFNASGVGAVAMGTNGGALTWAKVVELETAVANANADAGNLAYLTNSKVRGAGKTIEKWAGTGRELWQPGRDARNGVGEMNGYDAYVSNQVRSDYTKGTATSVCSGMAFGNWADLMIGLWGGLDLLLDPYAAATSGGKRVVALQDCDIAVRRGSSFAVCKDITTA